MKKLIIASVVLILGLATEVSHAQSRITPEQAKQMKAHRQQFSSKLNLSDSQSVQVRAIDSVYLKGLSRLRNQSGSRLSKLRSLKKLGATKDKQMKKILSNEQYSTYLELKAQSRENFRNNRNPNHNHKNSTL